MHPKISKVALLHPVLCSSIQQLQFQVENQLFPLPRCRDSTSTHTNSYNLAGRLKMPHRKFVDPEVECQIYFLPIIHYCLHYHYLTVGCNKLKERQNCFHNNFNSLMLKDKRLPHLP